MPKSLCLRQTGKTPKPSPFAMGWGKYLKIWANQALSCPELPSIAPSY